MSALVRKEIRLLLPAGIVAMLLVTAPIPLGQFIDGNSVTGATANLTVYGVAIACVILGLAGFGREISSRTLSLLLIQPRPRGEYWRAKIGVLFAFVMPLALFLGLVNRHFVPPSDRWEYALMWFITACVAVTGGLWTTLLFRQIIASFWISVLVPFAILLSVMSFTDEVAGEDARAIITIILMLAYSTAGYFFARWQFRNAQDTAWTGGNVSLSGFARWLPWQRTATARGKSHPLWALLGKEFQFQQINFLLAGLLLVVQIAALLLPRFVNTSERSVLDLIVQNCWGIWIVMPLLVGCGAVAEERKLGMLEPQLCLPISRTWQFAVKVFVTLLCGIVLGALVVVVLRPNHGANLQFAASWTLACVCLALVSFYASSLTNQLLQAFGAAVGIIVVGGLLSSWFLGAFPDMNKQFALFGLTLWHGPLVIRVGASVMLLAAMVLTWRRLRWVWVSFLVLVALPPLLGIFPTLPAAILAMESEVFGFKTFVVVPMALTLSPVILILTLAARNFQHTQTSLSLWWRNAATWLGCILLTGVITTLVYNRVWELGMRFEPPAGPARLSGSIQPVIAASYVDRPSFVLLPDGLLCYFKEYERIPPTHSGSDGEPVLRAIKEPKVEFVGGSNWVAIATTGREFGGVKSDGSLWRASWFAQGDHQGNLVRLHVGSPEQKNSTVRPVELKFEQIGEDYSWAAIAAGWSHFVTLKRDGTIWGWGDNSNNQLGEGPRAMTNGPVQIGHATNWTAVYAGNGLSYAVNRDGEIWKSMKTLATPATKTKPPKFEAGSVKLNIKVPGVRSMIVGNGFELILDTDGKLWGLGGIPPALSGRRFDQHEHGYSEAIRLDGTSWFSVSCNWNSLAGLKSDGTLWNQRGHVLDFYNWPFPKLAQLGKRSDWIAVMPVWGGDLAFAKDGTICRFGEENFNEFPLLAPTRRVTWSVNVLDMAK